MDQSIPIDFLRIISKECPDSLESYIQLWEVQDKNGRIIVQESEICDEFLISKPKFNRHIRELASASLITYKKINNKIVIEMASKDTEG